ncbi:MAG: hypothetical protein EBS69_08925 [Verrucomicrobia bacterium]|nr:hypothetical protein [Verrucomicrobiota bacterium]
MAHQWCFAKSWWGGLQPHANLQLHDSQRRPDPPDSLEPGQRANFSVRLAPTSSGAKAGILSISSNDGDENPFLVNFTGSGTGSFPPVFTSSNFISGQVGVSFSFQLVATENPTSYGASGLPSGIALNTTTGLLAGTPNAAGTNPGTVSASNAAGSVSQTVTFAIARGTPVISAWPTASAISYGQAVGDSVLSGGMANPAGSFLWINPGNRPNAGASSQSLAFLPADTNNYESVTNSSLILMVNKAVPVITWTNPVAITYGTALTTNQLNASASVAGNFVYSPTNGSVLNAGTNTLTVVFTASNTNYVSPVTNTVTLVVNKATPVLTWTPNPVAGLTYPEPLSFTQLNATSTVAGSFSYSPGPTAVLAAAIGGLPYPLSAVFTPTDTNNYSTATISNAVWVAKGTPVISNCGGRVWLDDPDQPAERGDQLRERHFHPRRHQQLQPRLHEHSRDGEPGVFRIKLGPAQSHYLRDGTFRHPIQCHKFRGGSVRLQSDQRIYPECGNQLACGHF